MLSWEPVTHAYPICSWARRFHVCLFAALSPCDDKERDELISMPIGTASWQTKGIWNWFASVASQFFHKFSRWIGLCLLLSCVIFSTFLPAIFSCASHILMFTPPCPSRQFLVIWTQGSVHLFVGLCLHTDFCTFFIFAAHKPNCVVVNMVDLVSSVVW